MSDKHQFFNGEMFTRDEKTGYYLCSRENECGIRKRMHVYVWEFYNGTVPDGYEVHHIDGNKSNNDISNLKCVKAEEHRRYHAENMTDERKDELREHQKKAILKAPEWHKSKRGREWHSQHSKNLWRNKKPKKYICDFCGKEFESINSYSEKSNKFCSNNCKSAYRRGSGVDNEIRKCEYCGKEFTVNKYAKKRFCSTECSFKAVPRRSCGNRNKKC